MRWTLYAGHATSSPKLSPNNTSERHDRRDPSPSPHCRCKPGHEPGVQARSIDASNPSSKTSAPETAQPLACLVTLIESKRNDHQAVARDLVQALLPNTGKAIRVGITGSPGVGKSTTIDALGMFLIERGHKVAVLAVDPSSARTGGSILERQDANGTALSLR